MKQKAKRFEMAGLSLVLFSFFVQAFVLNPLRSLADDALRYRIEAKMDTLYSIERANYEKLHDGVKESYFWANPDSFGNYKYAEQVGDIMRVSSQTKYASIVVALMFIIGSGCIITGKYSEYKDLQTSTPSPRGSAEET